MSLVELSVIHYEEGGWNATGVSHQKPITSLLKSMCLFCVTVFWPTNPCPFSLMSFTSFCVAGLCLVATLIKQSGLVFYCSWKKRSTYFLYFIYIINILKHVIRFSIPRCTPGYDYDYDYMVGYTWPGRLSLPGLLSNPCKVDLRGAPLPYLLSCR